MFKNVLVIDDHASVNQGIVQTLRNSTSIPQVAYSQYCEDAYSKYLKALQDDNPFDLVIIDLNFKADYRKQTIKSGLDLIILLRQKQPDIKIIIYSIEDRKTKIKSIIEKYQINGFISKGRYGLKELLDAIPNVYNNIVYTSKALEIGRRDTIFEIEELDIIILKELSLGTSQKAIAEKFHINNSGISSLSTIEKKINKLKVHFKAKNTTHLVAIAKDLGII